MSADDFPVIAATLYLIVFFLLPDVGRRDRSRGDHGDPASRFRRSRRSAPRPSSGSSRSLHGE